MYFLIEILSFAILLLLLFYIVDYYNKYRAGFLSWQNTEFITVYPRGQFLMLADQEGQFSLLRQNVKRLGKSYRQWYFRYGIIFNCVQAKDVERILSSQTQIKKGNGYNFIRPFLKNGLITSQGEKWFKRRRILTPAFHFNILQLCFTVFKKHCQHFLSVLKNETENENGSNMVSLAAQFTLKTLGETAMGVNLENSSEFQKYRKSIHDIGEIFLYRRFRPWLYNDAIFFFFEVGRKFQEALNVAHSFTKNVISTRRKTFSDSIVEDYQEYDENIYLSKKKRFAMLDTLLNAERRGEIDEEGICEETDTFMFAGHDTTSIGLTFILFLLSHHPEVQQKVLEEIQQTLSSKDEKILDMNDLNNMKYLDCVVKECLRIYPPVPLISRSISDHLDMNGLMLPKGVIVRIHIFDLHRDPEQFPDPMKFDPDRFLPENVSKRHPFAYVPFSAGPRNCIGQRFALLELKTAVAEILQNFELIPVTNPEEIVFLMDMTLKTKDPIKIKFKLR